MKQSKVHPTMPEANRVKKRKSSQRRLSTAADLQYPMFVTKLETVLDNYSDGKIVEPFQVLKRRGDLVNWEDLHNDEDAHIIFVSHEWLGWDEPDPDGVQIRTLCRVLKRLLNGEIERVDSDPKTVLYYKQKYCIVSKEWEKLLANTYIWFDWMSMPQPSAEDEETFPKDQMKILAQDAKKAIRSIPAYIERSDFMMILAPSATHRDRKYEETGSFARTCMRTWRRRGWCLLEFFATTFSRDKSHPILLVQSAEGTPVWISRLDCMNLCCGYADFTCCARNHVATTITQRIVNSETVKEESSTLETVGSTSIKRVLSIEVKTTREIPCDKPVVRRIMETMLRVKIKHLFDMHQSVLARGYLCMRHWWLRGLRETDEDAIVSADSVSAFKTHLRWKDDAFWDEGGISLLAYACAASNAKVVRELLDDIDHIPSPGERMRRLTSHIPKKGILEFGWPGSSTALHAAMGTGSPEIVRLLLERGADPFRGDVMGNDPLMMASAGGRVDNIDAWFEMLPEWDVEHKNTVVGGTAQGFAVSFGRNKLATVKRLLKAGASVRTLSSDAGDSILHSICSNGDADIDVLKFAIDALKKSESSLLRARSCWSTPSISQGINYQRQARTTKWSCIRMVFLFLYRTHLSRSVVTSIIAKGTGETPLHVAVKRGDADIVRILIQNGANPRIRTKLGCDAFNYCNMYGPFPEVMKELTYSI